MPWYPLSALSSRWMERPRSETHFLASLRKFSARSSSTNTVLPVTNMGSRESVLVSERIDLNAATAPPASLSWTPSTMLVADDFSKSVITTARILSRPRLLISQSRMSDNASDFEEEYAKIRVIGDAQALDPVSVICTPNNLSRAVISSAKE